MLKAGQQALIAKGFANRRRIQILTLLEKSPGLSVREICNALHINFKTASGHVLKLTITGLVTKHSQGTSVRHKLTPRAQSILKFLRILE